MSGKEVERSDHHRERKREARKREFGEKKEMGRTLEDIGAGSCQNIPYWKNDVLGLGMMGRK